LRTFIFWGPFPMSITAAALLLDTRDTSLRLLSQLFRPLDIWLYDFGRTFSGIAAIDKIAAFTFARSYRPQNASPLRRLKTLYPFPIRSIAHGSLLIAAYISLLSRRHVPTAETPAFPGELGEKSHFTLTLSRSTPTHAAAQYPLRTYLATPPRTIYRNVTCFSPPHYARLHIYASEDFDSIHVGASISWLFRQ
jgi:hypothetical protein